MASTFGKIFRVSTFGESHGAGVGAVVDGCPPGMPLCEADLQAQLDRRRPGQSDLTTPRQESDQVKILSGLESGITLGTPIGLLIKNRDQKPADYRNLSQIPRPSHADYTYRMKYGVQAASGGGRASARETAGRVAAGAIAELFLKTVYNVCITAWVETVGSITASSIDSDKVERKDVDRNPVRCPDSHTADKMIELIAAARDEADSIGGVVACVCHNVPAGWGEPVFEKLDAALGQVMMSLPAVKGFSVGSGFDCAAMRGSLHNDLFARGDGALITRTNHSGGIQGGISNGMPVCFKVAFKPPATIGKPQETVDYYGESAILAATGRHDPCVVPRAVPIVETMAAMVLADMALRQKAIGGR
jgi:chorismate synthase